MVIIIIIIVVKEYVKKWLIEDAGIQTITSNNYNKNNNNNNNLGLPTAAEKLNITFFSGR